MCVSLDLSIFRLMAISRIYKSCPLVNGNNQYLVNRTYLHSSAFLNTMNVKLDKSTPVKQWKKLHLSG